MRNYLTNNTVWSDERDDLGSKWANFKKTLSEITDMFIPKSISSSKKHKSWINKTTVQAEDETSCLEQIQQIEKH